MTPLAGVKEFPPWNFFFGAPTPEVHVLSFPCLDACECYQTNLVWLSCPFFWSDRGSAKRAETFAHKQGLCQFAQLPRVKFINFILCETCWHVLLFFFQALLMTCNKAVASALPTCGGSTSQLRDMSCFHYFPVWAPGVAARKLHLPYAAPASCKHTTFSTHPWSKHVEMPRLYGTSRPRHLAWYSASACRANLSRTSSPSSKRKCKSLTSGSIF